MNILVLCFWAGWYQIRNPIPSKNRNICGPSVIWSTNKSMVKRPIIDVVLKFGEEGIGPGLFHAEHLIRSDSQLAYYEIDAVTKRHSVIVPFENPPVGQDYSTYIFKFVCFNSCAGGPNRRPLALIFTLEQGNNVFGRVVLDLKICACPGRDRENAKTGMIPQNYFENLPKKKKLEEGKPEKKEEFTIKVKDVECYNFLLTMKRLFLGHKRFGRIPPECRALLQICKSSSDEDEKS
ncbi:Cellular tumor antigen p53 [Araneus ventricosus]|uniref:Cellular tumor antigen p53 n=1 Tax=Araneus ventricosus TaxID=182803 RepID=A0A4Y2HV63_ARAVE|nr:Cellular tumor antigen p53 [Araneus ventricosus]